MPTNLPDQNWTIPALADLADNPLAFNDFAADVLATVVLRYPNTATRDAFNGGRVAGDLSFTAGNTWYDRWTGAKWIPVTNIAVIKTADQTQNNTTALINDTQLVVSLPTANTAYTIEAFIRYSSSTTADIKYSFVGPAGSGGNWMPLGLATGATNPGDGIFSASSAVGSSLANGGNGVGTLLGTVINGRITTAAATGTLQFQWAQNSLDPTDTVVHQGSWLRVVAIS